MINNKAVMVLRFAEAEAEKTKAIARVSLPPPAPSSGKLQACSHGKDVAGCILVLIPQYCVQNYYTERVDQARAEGLRNMIAALGITDASNKVCDGVRRCKGDMHQRWTCVGGGASAGSF